MLCLIFLLVNFYRVPMKRGKPPFQGGRGRGGSSSSHLHSEKERSYTPAANSWRTIQKHKHTAAASSSTQEKYKKLNDFISQEQNPEPFSQIVKAAAEWIPKAITEKILYLELEDIPHMADVENLRQKYLDTNFYPTLDSKSRSWLTIMMKQKGLEITYFWNTENHSVPPQFSKCIIREVILPRQWAINPNLSLPLVKLQNSREVHSYNYWDYVDAFYKIFLFQNQKNRHTWLIKICPEILQRGLPTWFYDWWKIYGAELSILPLPIQQLYSKWLDTHPVLSKLSETEIIGNICQIYFFAEAEIPWIWTWSFEADFTDDHLPYLKRQYYIRWWSGIVTEEKETQLKEIISQNEKLITTSLAQSLKKENPIDKIAKMLRRKYPHIEESDLQRKCLAYMKEQFMAIFDTSDTKSKSSDEATHSRQTDAEMQEAQDPNEDDEIDIDQLWDAIEVPTQPTDKGKSKTEG